MPLTKGKKNTKVNASIKRRSKPFPIVAMGASAGGLEAVTALLNHLPSSTGMAYVYIQHLDPTHESMLSSLLQKTTKMKVMEAKNLMPIQANHLYVIPPGKDMTILDGVLRLQPRIAKPALHLPVNEFFLSLAEKQKDGAIGIVLSGNASDGALGLKAIKSAGGLTFAQDESAKFQGMPKAAVAEGAVDMVLSPEEIAKELARLSNHTHVIQRVMRDTEEEETHDGEDLTTILNLLRKAVGVDFLHYKQSTIRRRVIRRMLLHKCETLKDYAQYLRQHASELTLLYQDLLINVTSFFRDEPAMEYMKKTLLPKILKQKSPQDPIRIWVPGCSTGEEAYSIAIMLTELLKEKAPSRAVQIFATDLSELAINKARMGIYSKADLAAVSSKRLQNFFTQVDGSYRIIRSIREMCVFAPHNILKDPPFSRLDLISCCNMLIYLDASLQKKLMNIFHYALNSGGYLVLGKSESVGASGGLFSQLEKKNKIYSKKSDVTSHYVYDAGRRFDGEQQGGHDARRATPHHEETKSDDLEKTIDKLLLSRYVPASVVVNNDLDILQFRGSTGLYLEPSPGKASLNLLKMARNGLSIELRTAIQKSRRAMQAVRKSGIEIRHKGSTHRVSFEVYPFKSNNDDPVYLITFEEVTMPAVKDEKPSTKKDKRVDQLKVELRDAQEHMRSFMEQQETVNEELQSANEEVVSSNEELQSINEELETSKEEIEATNEELLTINRELQMRSEQLAESYDYTQNIIDTVREAMVVLNKDLLVKSCNQSFYRLFKTTQEETEGVLIYELGNYQWNIPALRELLEDIIPHNTTFNDFRVSHHFEGLGEKVMILNARKMVQKVQGEHLILLAIEDITEHVTAQRVLQEREQWIRNIADTAPVMMWFANTNRDRTFFNKTWLEYTGKKMEDETGRAWLDDIHKADIDSFLKIYNKAFDKQKPYTAEYRLRRYDGVYRWMLSSANPSYNSFEKFTGFVGSVTDIHDQRMAEEILRESENRTRMLLESLPQIAFTTLPDGTVNYSNNTWYKYTGDDPANPLHGEERRKLGHPDDKPALNKWLKKIEAGEPFEGEGRIRRSDGEYRWFLTRIVPVKNANGTIVQWIGTSTDIHEQKMFVEELERAVKKRTAELNTANFNLDRSNKELQQFAFAASHDLQEPLRKIQTFIDLISKQHKTDMPEDMRDYFRRILTAANRMRQLIEDLLNLSRANVDGKLFVQADLNTLMNEALSSYDLRIAQKNANIKVEELPTIECIPAQITQLFENLLSNSLKFTESPQPNIVVTSHKLSEDEVKNFDHLDKNTGWYEITFTDNGIGFEQKFAEQIFVTFQRLHDVKKYPGTGIGLALCKKIVLNHGGEIYAEAEENKGATIHILLPDRPGGG